MVSHVIPIIRGAHAEADASLSVFNPRLAKNPNSLHIYCNYTYDNRFRVKSYIRCFRLSVTKDSLFAIIAKRVVLHTFLRGAESVMTSKYSITFVRRGLLLHDSITLTELYFRLHDWSEVRQHAVAENLLQTRTVSTSKKQCSEIVSRLRTLTEEQLRLLATGAIDEQRYLLWLAVCKRYKLLFEFAVEVLHEKYLRLDLRLTYDDYDQFFNSKADWHEELSRLSTETHTKVRQTVFQLMREAHLINKQNDILPVLVSAKFFRILCKDSNDNLLIFPLSDQDARAFVR